MPRENDRPDFGPGSRSRSALRALAGGVLLFATTAFASPQDARTPATAATDECVRQKALQEMTQFLLPGTDEASPAVHQASSRPIVRRPGADSRRDRSSTGPYAQFLPGIDGASGSRREKLDLRSSAQLEEARALKERDLDAEGVARMHALLSTRRPIVVKAALASVQGRAFSRNLHDFVEARLAAGTEVSRKEAWLAEQLLPTLTDPGYLPLLGRLALGKGPGRPRPGAEEKAISTLARMQGPKALEAKLEILRELWKAPLAPEPWKAERILDSLRGAEAPAVRAAARSFLERASSASPRGEGLPRIRAAAIRLLADYPSEETLRLLERHAREREPDSVRVSVCEAASRHLEDPAYRRIARQVIESYRSRPNATVPLVLLLQSLAKQPPPGLALFLDELERSSLLPKPIQNQLPRLRSELAPGPSATTRNP